MNIAGFQSLSLIDYPGVIASVVFTQGCAFRCFYCHNPELIPLEATSRVTPETIFAHLEQHRKMLEGVVVTGGEPTIHADLPAFLANIKAMGFLVKLDTNGVHPNMVADILERKLVDYIAMDVKHRWEWYPNVTRKNEPIVAIQCKKTFNLIQHSGIAHEFRTTVVPGVHSEDDLLKMAAQLTPGERYAIQPVRAGKTLEPIPDSLVMDWPAVAERLRERYPSIDILLRMPA